MGKILMRAAMSPLENKTPYQVLTQNAIGNNIGNLLFPHSISRTLMTEDTVIDTINFNKLSGNRLGLREKIHRINEEYDCLILPFANAFRVSFMSELRRITYVVRRLDIPCIVVGIGMQTRLGGQINNKELNEVVTDFVEAVLEKSKYLGLRGEHTAEYLTSLGFQAERDFTVIGCPSMYMYGKDLPRPNLRGLTSTSTVSFNSKISLPQKFHDFIFRCRKEIKDYYYIPQVIEELRRMYVGMPFPEKFAKRVPEHFPGSISHPIYVRDKARSFINVQSWLQFLGEMDFSFGSRIHGNIAAVLSGTPAFVIVSDQRIKELVEYHNIQHIMMDELNKETDIFELYEGADFNLVLKGHSERFFHYLDFLRQNGLDTIYDEKGNAGRVYFDEALAKVEFCQALRAFTAVPAAQQAKRLDKFWGYMCQ